MKYFILISALLFIVPEGVSQRNLGNEYTKEYYLQKSKNQNTAAWILLSAGGLMTIIGAVSFNDSWDNGSASSTDTAGFIMLGGVASSLVSIPLFISSGKNARKAAKLSINNQAISLPQQNNIVKNYNPSLSLKINF